MTVAPLPQLRSPKAYSRCRTRQSCKVRMDECGRRPVIGVRLCVQIRRRAHPQIRTTLRCYAEHEDRPVLTRRTNHTGRWLGVCCTVHPSHSRERFSGVGYDVLTCAVAASHPLSGAVHARQPPGSSLPHFPAVCNVCAQWQTLRWPRRLLCHSSGARVRFSGTCR